MGISKEHEGEGEGEQAQERVWSMCRRWAAVWIKEEKEKKGSSGGRALRCCGPSASAWVRASGRAGVRAEGEHA